MIELRNYKNSLDEGYLLHWYEIIKVIGRGGFGITYLAHDNNLDRNVAIKEFMPEDFATREADSTVHPKTGEQKKLYSWGLDRFIAEARTLAKFNHPNIVRVQSVFEENNTAYMVMEYAQGKDLSKVYKSQPKFSEEQLLDIFIPVLDGLSLVHNAGFIHRDIKPANIYICDNNSPLLLDFGSARQSIGSKTKALTSLVTFGYAPYEQYNEGSGKQGPWTDIYSLGASIYFGITGKKPVDALFRGGSFLDKGIDTYEPVSILAKDEYSENFLLSVDKALMFKIDERPKDILSWADMLLEKQPAPALPDYMLNPPQPEDETELNWSDTELGYNTEISRSVNSGTQGLVDSQGKRNTQYTQATVIRPRDNNASPVNDQLPPDVAAIKQEVHSETKKTSTGGVLSRVSKPVMLVSAAGVFILIVLFGWLFNDFSAPEKSDNADQLQAIPKQISVPENAEKTVSKNKIRIQNLLSNASKAMIQKNYTQPVNNNAFGYYQQVLKFDANNKPAHDGIQTIENQLFKRAGSALTNKNYKLAENYLAQLNRVNSGFSGAVALQQQIRQERQQKKQISNWLHEADRYIKNNRYIGPDNKNAYAVYRKVLTYDALNEPALNGLKKIQKHYVSLFNQHLSARQFNRAKRDIQVMTKLSAPEKTLKGMQKKLKSAQTKNARTGVSVKPKKVTLTLNIEQVSGIIGRFKLALQAGDKNKITAMSQYVPGRKQFVKQFLDEYREFTVKVSQLEFIPKENRAQAVIELKDLVDVNGKKITPGNWSQFNINVRYNRQNQLKIYW